MQELCIWGQFNFSFTGHSDTNGLLLRMSNGVLGLCILKSTIATYIKMSTLMENWLKVNKLKCYQFLIENKWRSPLCYWIKA